MYQYIYLKPHQVKLDNIQQIGVNQLLGSDTTGDIIPVTVGSGLTLNSGTISATAIAYSASQTEVDFGSSAVSSAAFTITDANVSTSSKIIAQVAGIASTDKTVDEVLIEALDVKCTPYSGSLGMYIQTDDGSYISGKVKVNYSVSA